MLTLEMIQPEQTQFKSLISRYKNLPLWIKQAVYCLIKEDISECSDLDLLDSIDSKIIQLYKPRLTSNGLKLIDNKSVLSSVDSLKEDHKRFLQSSREGLNLLEIAHKNNWSFKLTCEVYLDLSDAELVDKLNEKKTETFLLYLVGRIRLGEFLVRTDRLTLNQLDKALYTKKCADELDTGLGFKDVLVNLNYMKLKEINNICSIKDSSEHCVTVIDEAQTQAEELNIIQDELDASLFKVKKLEEQLKFYKKELDEKNQENLELTKQLQKYTKGFVGKLLTNFS
ncbi:MAG: hypothetical protein AB1782_16125 [Cyanobacteriota bacterium]